MGIEVEKFFEILQGFTDEELAAMLEWYSVRVTAIEFEQKRRKN